MVEEFDTTRRKSFALLRVGGRGDPRPDLDAADFAMLKRASRSFSKVCVTDFGACFEVHGSQGPFSLPIKKGAIVRKGASNAVDH
jgi:hypothetical protein